jgi:glucuronokinase
MKVHIRVPARVGLAGNPSDGYGGRVVAAAISGFEAHVRIEPATGVRIASDLEGDLAFPSVTSLLDRRPPGARDPHRLAIACCRRFMATAVERGWLEEFPPPGEGFRLGYASDIPFRVGLGGSSAIAVAMLRALSARYGEHMPEADLPALALAVETQEMGIHGGLMDRVVQVFGGVMHMDLSGKLLRETGRGVYEPLPADRLPPLFIAWRPDLASGSQEIHNPLRERTASGEAGVARLLADLADLADAARRVLLSGSPGELAPIMDANFELRAKLVEVGEGNRQLVETGRRLGAGVKQAGSGGAVVGVYDGDPDRGEHLRHAYSRIGARFSSATVWAAPTAGSTRNEADHRPNDPAPGP